MMKVLQLGLLILLSVWPLSSWSFTLGSLSTTQQGWNTKVLTFKVNYSGCSISNDRLNTAIDTAINLWNKVATSGVRLERGGETGTTVAQGLAYNAPDPPVILCDTNFTANFKPGDVNFANVVLAVTLPKTTNDQMSNAALILNSESGKSGSIETKSDILLSIVLAHEMGHVLGLGHTSDTSALMYFSASLKTELGLSQDDIDGISYLYPRNELGGAPVFGCGIIDTPENGRNSSLGFGVFLVFLVIAWVITRKYRYGIL